MATAPPRMLYSAVLTLGDNDLRGALSIGEEMRFSPPSSFETEFLDLRRDPLYGVLVWGRSGVRYQQRVEVLHSPRPQEVVLVPVDTLRTTQQRESVRREACLTATVMVPEANGVMLRRGRTVDVSTGGVAVIFDRDADEPMPYQPPETGHVGVVFDLPDMRINAVAEIVSTITTGARSGLRVRFANIHRADIDAIARFVSRTEIVGVDHDALPDRPQLKEPVRPAIEVDPNSTSTFSCALLVDPMQPVVCQVIDDRFGSARLQLDSIRGGLSTSYRSRYDIRNDQPLIVYESTGLWMLGTIARIVADELSLHLVAA